LLAAGAARDSGAGPTSTAIFERRTGVVVLTNTVCEPFAIVHDALSKATAAVERARESARRGFPARRRSPATLRLSVHARGYQLREDPDVPVLRRVGG